MNIVLTTVGLMAVVAVAGWLVMVSLAFAKSVLGFVSMWRVKLLGFSLVLFLVLGLSGGLGSYPWRIDF